MPRRSVMALTGVRREGLGVAGSISVSRRGGFDHRFSQRTGTGRTYFRIYGRFLTAHTASVAYLVDYVQPGEKVKNPYDTGHRHRLGCASWVR